MRDDPLYTIWSVQCESVENATAVQQFLKQFYGLDSVIADRVRAFPDGMEVGMMELSRMGEYFQDIQIVPSSNGTASAFFVVFHRLPTATKGWKDVMIQVLQAVRGAASNVVISFVSRGSDSLVASLPALENTVRTP